MAATRTNSSPVITGVYLSKMLGSKPIYLREEMVVITDESKGSSQLLGARARAAPKSTPTTRDPPFIP